jgi:hypothetical protein
MQPPRDEKYAMHGTISIGFTFRCFPASINVTFKATICVLSEENMKQVTKYRIGSVGMAGKPRLTIPVDMCWPRYSEAPASLSACAIVTKPPSQNNVSHCEN